MPALLAIEPQREESTMQTQWMKRKLWLTSLGAVALLTACGGGRSDNSYNEPPAVAKVAGSDLPVTVEQSTMGLIDFAKAQVATTSETNDPLLLGEAKLATDDGAEPSDV